MKPDRVRLAAALSLLACFFPVAALAAYTPRPRIHVYDLPVQFAPHPTTFWFGSNRLPRHLRKSAVRISFISRVTPDHCLWGWGE